MNRLLMIISIACFVFPLSGQNKDYAREQIDTLASESMHGRGYVNNGVRVAADYLVQELKDIGVFAWKGGYRQACAFPVNTFPGNMYLNADGKTMKPGYDFQVKTWSEGLTDTLKVLRLEEKHLKDMEHMRKLRDQDLKDYLILLDPKRFSDKMAKNLNNIAYVNFFGAAGYVNLVDAEKLMWSVAGSHKMVEHIVIDVKREAWNDATRIILDIESRFYNQYETANVIGYLKGREEPDSFVLITAHYDHLGRMGENTCYCGAHDNASGTALTLDLASYFAVSQNRPRHSLLFVFFSGEEAGLHGSRFFADNPPLNLDKVKFVVNLDIVGTGSKGIKVVNGAILKKQFELLKSINEQEAYVTDVKKRGEAANSDHYPLYAKGIPAFFVYTLGDEYKEYHNPDDVAKALPLTAYEGLFRLIRDYVEQL
ncbi:MAG: M28 family peptidase [Bacteroidales bacterium]